MKHTQRPKMPRASERPFLRVLDSTFPVQHSIERVPPLWTDAHPKVYVIFILGIIGVAFASWVWWRTDVIPFIAVLLIVVLLLITSLHQVSKDRKLQLLWLARGASIPDEFTAYQLNRKYRPITTTAILGLIYFLLIGMVIVHHTVIKDGDNFIPLIPSLCAGLNVLIFCNQNTPFYLYIMFLDDGVVLADTLYSWEIMRGFCELPSGRSDRCNFEIIHNGKAVLRGRMTPADLEFLRQMLTVRERYAEYLA